MSNRYLSTLFKSGEEFEEFLNKLDAFKKGIEKGTIIIPESTKATQDANGNNIANTYATKTDLTEGNITVRTSYKADCDRQGSVIHTAYAKKTDLTSGKITVQKATQDANGNNIVDTYATKDNFEKIAVETPRSINSLSKTGYYYIELQVATSTKTFIPLGVIYWSSATIIKEFYYENNAYTFSVDENGTPNVMPNKTPTGYNFILRINPWQ